MAPEPYVSRYVKPGEVAVAEYTEAAWLTRCRHRRRPPALILIAARPVAGPGEQLAFWSSARAGDPDAPQARAWRSS